MNILLKNGAKFMRNLMIVAVSCFLLTACNSAMQMGGSNLEEIAQGFSESMRWHDFPNAAGYIDPEARIDFEEKFIEDDDLRIVESRVLSVDILPDGEHADIVYQLEYYHLPSSRIKKWRWKQRWELGNERMIKTGIWMIKNEPPDLPWQKPKAQ